jgi:hypothetical protein
MDFRLDDDQTAILESVSTLLARHAGPSRLRNLGGDAPVYDHALEQCLDDAGFLEVVSVGACDRLNAALVQEAISVSLGCVATGVQLLVAPSLPDDLAKPIAVVRGGHFGPARFLADARTVVIVDDGGVRVATPAPGEVSRPSSRLGWPVGMAADLPAGRVLSDVDPREITTWTRTALAVELVGAMRFAIDLTVGYVTGREQFGRSIGSFQAVQHGLSECAVAIEGARWLALESAESGSTEGAAYALAHAIEAVKLVFPMTHQYSGAIGFTQEYDLHLATMRTVAMRAEGEVFGRPATAAAYEHWAFG